MKKVLIMALVVTAFIFSISAMVANGVKQPVETELSAKELYQSVVSLEDPEPEGEKAPEDLQEFNETSPELNLPEAVPLTFDQSTVIQVQDGDTVLEIPMDTYLQGVLLGEMPASFELEAMKAQAVAARTFTLKTMESKKHEQSDVCTDSACCQAWENPETSNLIPDHQAKLAAAVSQTDGQVLTYQDSLIDATYFSCSGGLTESAVAVWGNDVPYLQSVESPGEENAARYEGEVSVDKGVFVSILASAKPEVRLTGDPQTWFGEVIYTSGGGVDTMEIGGCQFSGPQLRSLFGLNSTMFTIEETEETIIFHTKGFGHRVGLSQYGANARAAFGEKYDQILAYYYGGTQIKTLSPT